MRLVFLFVLLVYSFHSLMALSRVYICIDCIYYGMRIHEYSNILSFKLNVIENWCMYFVHLRTFEMIF